MKRIFMVRGFLVAQTLLLCLGIGQTSLAQDANKLGLVCFEAIQSVDQNSAAPDFVSLVAQAVSTCQNDSNADDKSIFASLDSRCRQVYTNPSPRDAECDRQALHYVNSLHRISGVIREKVNLDELNTKIDDLYTAKDAIYDDPNEMAIYIPLQNRCVQTFGQDSDANLLNFCKFQAVSYMESLRPY